MAADNWTVDPSEPPVTAAWGHFAAGKWDHEYARNVLLHFIEQRGLSEELLVWLDENCPTEKEEENDDA